MLRPLHNSILASFIIFFTMKSMVSFQIFAKMRVMQRSQRRELPANLIGMLMGEATGLLTSRRAIKW
jgi:hypothetical protein